MNRSRDLARTVSAELPSCQPKLRRVGVQWIDEISVEGTLSSTAFSHIFQGGYSAGYYSYKWAEVLDADAFERFKEEGIFSEVAANGFAEILSSGGTVAPDELFKKFRGRDPKVDALLKRAGIAA